MGVQAGGTRVTEQQSKTDDSRVLPFGASPFLAKVMKARYLARGGDSVCVFERAPGRRIKDFRARRRRRAGRPGSIGAGRTTSVGRARQLSRLGVPEEVITDLSGRTMGEVGPLRLRHDLAP